MEQKKHLNFSKIPNGPIWRNKNDDRRLKHQRSLWKMSKTCLPRLWLFATVHEGAAETGQGREEELVALVRYIREVWSETWGCHLCQAGTVAGGCLESNAGVNSKERDTGVVVYRKHLLQRCESSERSTSVSSGT